MNDRAGIAPAMVRLGPDLDEGRRKLIGVIQGRCGRIRHWNAGQAGLGPHFRALNHVAFSRAGGRLALTLRDDLPRWDGPTRWDRTALSRRRFRTGAAAIASEAPVATMPRLIPLLKRPEIWVLHGSQVCG